MKTKKQKWSNTIFVYEVKMRRCELGIEAIDTMKDKIASLSVPKKFGICPVLLHLGSILDALLSNQYFYRIIDVTACK